MQLCKYATKNHCEPYLGHHELYVREFFITIRDRLLYDFVVSSMVRFLHLYFVIMTHSLCTMAFSIIYEVIIGIDFLTISLFVLWHLSEESTKHECVASIVGAPCNEVSVWNREGEPGCGDVEPSIG